MFMLVTVLTLFFLACSETVNITGPYVIHSRDDDHDGEIVNESNSFSISFF